MNMNHGNKIVISASVALAATNAFAFVEQAKIAVPKDDIHLTDEDMEAIASAIGKKALKENLARQFHDLLDIMEEDGETLRAKYLPEPIMMAQHSFGAQDSTDVQFAAMCYSNCHSNCHGACHGSRGWR